MLLKYFEEKIKLQKLEYAQRSGYERQEVIATYDEYLTCGHVKWRGISNSALLSITGASNRSIFGHF